MSDWIPLLGTGLAIRRECLDEAQARRNHGGQTLDRLAERGGLSPDEALAVAKREPWKFRHLREALGALVEIALSAAPAASSDEQDARRLDWLSEHSVAVRRLPRYGTGPIVFSGEPDLEDESWDLRAAIDAAMKEAK